MQSHKRTQHNAKAEAKGVLPRSIWDSGRNCWQALPPVGPNCHRRRHAAANSTATSSRYMRQVQPLLENAQPPTRRSVGLRFCIRCCRSPHHSPARLSVNACIDSMPCNVRACSAVRLYPTSAGACELHWTTRQASVCLTHAARIDPEAVSGSCGQRQPLALPCCPPPR